MSIVAWDGKTLATDRLSIASDLRRETIKSRQFDTYVLAWTGDIAAGLAMADWYEHQAEKPFPACQADKDRWCRLIVASQEGVYSFEQEPYPIHVTEPFAAWGAGRDYALGAMAMGADAIEAVKIACRFSVTCGIGIDAYALDGPVPTYWSPLFLL